MTPPLIVQASSVGRRETNEDRVAHWLSPEAALMAVADGLGGHAHGELAAAIAVEILGAAFRSEAKPKLADPAAFLERSLNLAHAAIVRESEQRRFHENPRTVLVACVVQDGHAYWTHVGDCRFYVFRTGRIAARSRDHTVVQRLVDEGRIREEAAGTHPHRNRLLQCLGGIQTPQPEPTANLRLAREDIVLLCSDGFWGPLTPRQMMHALLSRPLAEAIPELVALAESRAGIECDNISVVAMTWNQDEQAAGAPTS